MKLPMRPHKEQDGWVYMRVRRWRPPGPWSGVTYPAWLPVRWEGSGAMGRIEPALYSDATPGSRIISSRRTEEAVETADYLKLCADEGLHASFQAGRWLVYDDSGCAQGASTLRAAYHRYKAQAGEQR